MDDVKRAEEALASIPPDLAYEEWMRIGMAAQAAGISFEHFDRWCAGSQKYEAAAVRTLWKSFNPDKGITAGTLFHYSKQYGHAATPSYPLNNAPALNFDLQRFIKNTIARTAGADVNVASDAHVIWSRCLPASNNHPYIERKHGSPNGLRVVPDDDELTIMGGRMAGALVIPVQRPDGSISSLQFVAVGDTEAQLKAAGKPTKLNLPRAALEGWYTVGTPAPGDRMFVCEGIGQAWACWQATGQAAVVSFGWGRMLTVAKALKQQHPDVRLVLVPDKGKEGKAMEHAAELACCVAPMPNHWPENSDVNDLALRDGIHALAELLDQAIKLDTEVAASSHPLAQYVDYDCQARAPKWVIPGFIGQGVVIIAGAHGVGKTTALLPLAMVAAGLHGPDDSLAPKHWRHVIYIVEDIEQAQRILAGMVGFSSLQLDQTLVKMRLHLVAASRLPADQVAEVGTAYRETFTRTVDGIAILPLVVIDTKSAVIAMENENDNAEGSKAMAYLKQGFEGLPTWIIGHMAKQDIGRSDVATLTTRGSSSIEADANQVLYLVKESTDVRYLVRGKTRFEAKWAELEIDSQCAETEAPNEFGELETVLMRWGIARPSKRPRSDAVAEAKARDAECYAQLLTQEIIEAVDKAWHTNVPVNRQVLKNSIKRNRNKVHAELDRLISERWLYEVEVPAALRTNPKRRYFLVALTPEERETLLQDGVLPDAKVAIPPSWRKPEQTDPA